MALRWCTDDDGCSAVMDDAEKQSKKQIEQLTKGKKHEGDKMT